MSYLILLKAGGTVYSRREKSWEDLLGVLSAMAGTRVDGVYVKVNGLALNGTVQVIRDPFA